MEAVLDGETHRLKPGDMLLINRGQWHQFTTVGGCIFEEISTTHIIGDSYYEDNAIAVLDPIRRKTVLDMW
jgi:N-acetylneuraminate synthase